MSDAGAVWVRTMPTLDGQGYMVVLESNDDTARELTPAAALLHAAGVLAAVARAEYDAAVIRQLMHGLHVETPEAAQIIADLREARRPADLAATAPLLLEPGINADLEPFLTVKVNGEVVGQWGMSDAEQHALFVVKAVEAAELDSVYLKLLTDVIDVDPVRAARVIDDLGSHRGDVT